MISRKEASTCALVLRHILYGEQTPFAADTDWRSLRQIVELHGIDSLVDCCTDPALSPLKDQKKASTNAVYHQMLRYTVQHLFQEIEKRGIKAAVMKGIALDNCYPANSVRTSSDIDIFVPGTQRQAFSDMMRDMGNTLVTNIHNGQTGVDTYVTPIKIELEVHYIIYYRMGARQRKLLRDNGFFSDRFFMPDGDQDISYLTFAPIAHLIYLLYHTGKHMLTHTLSFRMLADITMYVNRYADQIEKEKLLDLLKQLSLLRMSNALFCFCMRYLGMRQDFWKKTGPAMETALRQMMNNEKVRFWERFPRRYVWSFYPIKCVEKDNEYYIQYTYHPWRAFTSKYNLATFVTWFTLRVIWQYEIDTSGDIS